MRVLFVLMALAYLARGQTEFPTEPAVCSSANMGRCHCSTEPGFTTYTFWLFDEQRCFTIYRPPIVASTPTPVMMHANCYAVDRLGRLGMTPGSSMIQSAKEYGVVVIGVSQPNGRRSNWRFTANCREGKDLTYIRTIVEYLRSAHADLGAIYTEGFSQNAMFSGYMGYCLRDLFAGSIQGGGGLHWRRQSGGIMRGSSKTRCENQSGETCISWPTTPTEDFTNCVLIHRRDGFFGSAQNMFEFMSEHNNDVRYVVSTKSTGGHNWIDNWMDWAFSCLGVTESCSSACSNNFISCLSSSSQTLGAEKFRECNVKRRAGEIAECTATCAPSLEMLSGHEDNTVSYPRGIWGRPTVYNSPAVITGPVVNCDGSWSTCDASCGRTFMITTFAANGGMDCDAEDGDSGTCEPGEDECPMPDPVDCEGLWSSCDTSCMRTWTETVPASHGGAACLFHTGDTELCSAGEGDCPSATSTSHYLVKGSTNSRCRETDGCATVAGNNDDLHAVRCCSDVEITNWRAPLGQACNVWHESDVWGECKELNWSAANEFCTSMGGRLCTKEEVEAGCAGGTGCGFNARLIWTNTEAGSTRRLLKLQ